ncbi:DUF2007 domain-containing protein [bacterium]|nr:DUF2007 domain-containing protein [bacterium]
MSDEHETRGEIENGNEHEEYGREGDVPAAVACTVAGEMEAEAVRTALESAGIPVRIKMESVTKLIAVTVDGLGAVEVLVPPGRLDEAKAILASTIDQDELTAQALAGATDDEDGKSDETDASETQ